MGYDKPMGEKSGAATADVVRRFNEATNRHDVAAMMALMSDDVVFENTTPPDGRRFEGQRDVREAWEELFAGSPGARFETEDLVAHADRCVVRWRYLFDGEHPDGGHVRGVDLFRVRDGKVTEKLSYVKG